MLLQEVGFDVVSAWSQMGYLAKAVIIFVVLAVVFLAGAMIAKAVK